MAGTFGKQNLTSGTQAALSDRFMLEIEGLDFALVESVARPGYKIETESFQLMEYKFNFPKKVDYDNTIEITIVELLDPNVEITQLENVMSRLLNNSFYTTPSGIRDPKNPFVGQPKSTSGALNPITANNFGEGAAVFAARVVDQGPTKATLNVSKEALTNALSMNTRSPVVIHTLDSEGRKYESIRLTGAMITNVKFSGLKYSSADVNKITLTLTFDYVDFGRNGVYNYGNTYDKFRGLFPNIANAIKDPFRRNNF